MIRPRGECLLIEIDKDPVERGGVIISAAIERPRVLEATVRAVGDKNPNGLKPGDRVMIDKAHAFAVVYEREPEQPARELVMAKQNQIEAVLS